MKPRVSGRLTTEKFGSDGHRVGLIGYRVSLRLPGSLFNYDGVELGQGMTAEGLEGFFDFEYSRSPAPVREVEIVVHDQVGRRLMFKTESGREFLEDRSSQEVLNRWEDFIVREVDATGLLTTLGKGVADGFSEGNRLTWLMDHDAFARAAQLIEGARESILMSQLFFSLPSRFNANPTAETTKLVFDFDRAPGTSVGVPPDLDQPRAVGIDDARPERLLLRAADAGVDVRILLNDVHVPLALRIVICVFAFPYKVFDGFSSAWHFLGSDLTDTDEARRYFGQSGRSSIKVQNFEQPILSTGVMHAKLMIVDGRHVLSIGSPFGQSYVDTQEHRIDAWIRGGSEGLPKHDAGFHVTGPALTDVYQTMKLLWDTATPGDTLPDFPGPNVALPAPTGSPSLGEDGICAMQFVRTLSAGRFESMEEGEKGILESYQRAIAAAEDFVYLETQYFTNDAIGDALVGAMKRRPELQVIVVLNITPDVFLYPFKQRRLITRIRKAISTLPGGWKKRFGVFTRWTHEVGQPRPRILPIYVHAKAGVVDDQWATVGSANLDGLSLDAYLHSDWFRNLFNAKEQRAIEVNGVALNTSDYPSEVVGVLRRKLWAEHLGYFGPHGVLDLTASELVNRPSQGWLGLWRDRASETLRQLVDHPTLSQAGMGRVLPWPEDDTTYKTPRKHLNALGVRTYAVVPLKSTRKFDFKQGIWTPGSKPAMDYD